VRNINETRFIGNEGYIYTFLDQPFLEFGTFLPKVTLNLAEEALYILLNAT